MQATNGNLALVPGSDEATGISFERVATGFEFTEGPVWIPDQKSLLFSDIPADRIYRYQAGKVEIFHERSGHSNGLTTDPMGRLIICEHGNRRVVRMDPDGIITILADVYNGKRLNSPNDIVVRSDGLIFFTDPPYGIPRSAQEQPVQGVYCLTEGRGLNLIADDFELPNGLAFSPDEKKLYINDSGCNHIRVFDVTQQGLLINGRIFAEMKSRKEGVADGMKINRQGVVFCTGPGGIWVFNPEGDCQRILSLPELPSNCAWGDSDCSTLYVTARTSVYRLRFAGEEVENKT